MLEPTLRFTNPMLISRNGRLKNVKLREMLLVTTCATVPGLESYLRKQIELAQQWLDNDSWWPNVEKYVLITQDRLQAQHYDETGVGYVLGPVTATMTGVICRNEGDAMYKAQQWNREYPDNKLGVEHYRDALRASRLKWQLMLSEVQRLRVDMTQSTVTKGFVG